MVMEEKQTNILRIDLACGDNKKGEDWIGVDKVKTSSVDIVHDLNIYPWPFEDSSVDEINCTHYAEHVPHDAKNGNDLDGFIQFMNEIYRILKPGGKIKIVSPYYTSIRAYGDPTHVRSICDWTFLYFNKDWRDKNKLSHYGIVADFDVNTSYYITNEITLKSDEVRQRAFIHDWNVIEDIIVDLIKRN